MKNRWMKAASMAVLLLGTVAVCGEKNVSKAAENPAYTLTKGKRATLSTIVKKNPITAAELAKNKKKYSRLTWKSGNKKIVRVIGNRKIKGLKKGKTYVRGYNKSGKKVIALRVCVGKKVSGIKLTPSSVSLNVGKSLRVKVKISPSSASNKNVFFSSSDETVATVSKKGKIQAVSSGSATVTVTSKDGRAKKKLKVSVKSELIRTTSKGLVKGVEDADVKLLKWYGVPYGADTSGANRWKAPQPVAAWSGVRDATVQKAPAAQYNDGVSYQGTEDCLYVNVYRPNNGAVNLPVIVYLHGGGNASGNANENFSKMVSACNVVMVSVEYRLGAFGNLSHPALRTGTAEENSGNFALLDIKEALTWVQGEIANFGGNPGNVTLSGFSAGARNAMLCLISPQMRGLFHKALIMSGGCNTCTSEQGEKSAETKLAEILVKRGTYQKQDKALEYVQSASDEEIRALFQSLSTVEVAGIYQSSGLRLDKFPHGFADGVVIPKEGFSVIPSGNYNRVPVILGTDATEFSSFAWNGNLTSGSEDLTGITTTTQMLNFVANSVKYGSMLQSGHYVEKTAELLSQDPLHASIYAYRFKWGTNANVSDGFYSRYVGAYHGASRDFLRAYYKNNYTEYAPNAISTANKPGRQALTAQMQKYISNFIVSGNPNSSDLPGWGTWVYAEGSPKIMSFDANATSSTSAMSSEHYREADTFAQMRSSLTKSEYNLMTKSLLKGRFFMPDNVPEY